MARGTWHEGERRAQEKAGVHDRMAGAGPPGPLIPAAAADFLAERSWVIATFADGGGAPRIEALTGPPGFVRAAADSEIRIEPDRAPPVAPGAAIGLLAIEPATKRRMKAKGVVTDVRAASGGSTSSGSSVGGAGLLSPESESGRTLAIRTVSVYALCPKHITPRDAALRPPGIARPGAQLTEAQRSWIEGADTFFLATHSPEGGADASHRGGSPGFITVIDDRTLAFPDYSGNNMFNTIGNLEMDPRIALLFVDFRTGGRLTLHGSAAVEWDAAERERRIVIRVQGTAGEEAARF